MEILGFALAQQAEQGLAPTFIMFGLMFAIMYFLVLKPQQQREAERKDMQGRLKKNDHVVTTSGIHGTVTSVKDDEVTLRVDDAQNVRIRFARSAIAGIVGESESSTSEEKK